MPVADLAAAAVELAGRHQAGTPLVLPNAWDVASARQVVAAGFPVVATSSAAVAAVHGFEDHEAMPPGVAFDAVREICAGVDVPVTADLEAGYGLAPADVIARLLDAGAVGCNIEDTDHGGGGLVDAERLSARIAELVAAGRRAGVAVVVNARVDVWLAGEGSIEERHAETRRRARQYLDAGAVCVYPIGLADERVIGALVDELAAPVNILLRRGAPSREALARLGVARLSVGSGLFRTAQRSVDDGLAELR